MQAGTPSFQTHPLITVEHLSRKALVYIRQSSLEQVEKNTGSQAFQRNQVEVARAYGWPEQLIEVIDEDLGKSGSSVDRRTGWQRMLDQITARAVGAVFAANISRLGRELLQLEELRVMASYFGVLLCIDGRITDPRNPNDTVLTQVTASFAQYENKKRTEHMTRARIAKAQAGAVVSPLPVGWVKGPDGTYDFDPAVKEPIAAIFATFWQQRSIRRTVTALTEAGVKIPGRVGKQLSFKDPTLNGVRRILINPAYVGTYVFGKTQSQIGRPASGNGQSARVKVPAHLWIQNFNHHPGYITQEQQQEIKQILAQNHFIRRNRPGRGPALTQGLLRCAVCKRSLSVNYHRYRTYSYGCGWERHPCTRFCSFEFDQYILREVFRVLERPPVDMLRSALTDARSQEQARLDWIESERERLEHEERKARERADLSHGSLRRVHIDALEKLENVLRQKEEFEIKATSELTAAKKYESDEELKELCELASDVPRVWHHAAVTHQERKQILRCLIDHIVVGATKERIDATIFWKGGCQTLLVIWRGIGCYNLIRELHEQNLTVFEIKDYLAAGKTSTGQSVNISLGRIYMILQKLGLKPERFSKDYLALRQEAAQLNRDGRPLTWIADHFNERGYESSSGIPWTRSMINGLIRATGDTARLLEDIHRRAIVDARALGLKYREMAIEFNEKKIRRRDGQPWTARDIRKRWADLNRLQRNRIAKGLTTTELSEPVVVSRST